MAIDKSKQVSELIDKAAAAHDSGDAMRFSQAACNAANAWFALQTQPTPERP